VISAEDDLFGTFKGERYTAEHIPGARFIGYPTGGHLLVGHGGDVRRELAEFLKLHTASQVSTSGSPK
jgi:2-hydroxy-6-oxonona-2,4-dienedioate hydrolase